MVRLQTIAEPNVHPSVCVIIRTESFQSIHSDRLCSLALLRLGVIEWMDKTAPLKEFLTGAFTEAERKCYE